MTNATKTDPVEAGTPADDIRAFRRSLGHFATGITVITADVDGQSVGVTANSFSSVSLDPPLVLWSADLKSKSLPVFKQATHFAISVLAADQTDIAAHFAKSGGDKFSGVEWQPGLGGAPVLVGVAATFECRRVLEHEAGDHVIFIGQVENFARFERPLLLFAFGRYGLSVDHPGQQSKQAASVDPLPNTLMRQVRTAWGRMSAAFQAHRDAEGLTVNESRVLWQLQEPDRPIETIAQDGFLALEDTKDAISAMISNGYVILNDRGVPALTPTGRDRILALRQRAQIFEAKQLERFSAADVETMRRVLESLGID